MRIFGTLVICGWSKPYLELSDFPENWYGKSLQHILDAKNVLAVVSPPPTPPWQQKSIFAVTAAPAADAAAKTFFASRICCKDLPYQFSGKSDNSKYGLLQLQITSVANILILPAPLWSRLVHKTKFSLLGGGRTLPGGGWVKILYGVTKGATIPSLV